MSSRSKRLTPPAQEPADGWDAWRIGVREFAATLSIPPEHEPLVARALTHRSLADNAPEGDNERLELLGDAVVALVVLDHLHHTFPERAEGELTKLKARYVSRPSLAIAARSLRLDQKIAPTEGGTLREGIVGTFTGTNPLYATTIVDGSIARLLFSSLLTHDKNGSLVSDLAEKWESDDKGQVYKFTLKKNVRWHDNVPLTSKDVIFTYKTIQNADAKSPLFASWLGVDVVAPDDYTVMFTLPSPLAAFPYSLTKGIVPKHILESTPVTQLRSVPFNTVQPIGSGPFKWGSVEVLGDTRETRTEQIALRKNPKYHYGAPKIDQYVLKTFRDESIMQKAFELRELTAIVTDKQISSSAAQDANIQSYNIPLLGEVMIFFNTNREVLKDVRVRSALASSTDQTGLLRTLGYPVVSTNSPLLKSQVGYDPKIVQRTFSSAEADKLFAEAGWTKNENGILSKDKTKLTLKLKTQNSSDYVTIAQSLQKQWATRGVETEVKFSAEEDMQSDVLANHDYDVLLYGITLGRDPDVFAYWHSSQIDVRLKSRLNFSEYNSLIADKALEAGRTRTDPAVRAVKYKPFLTAWRDDVPAISLYEPRFLYITRSELAGFNAAQLLSPVDRLNGIINWTVLQDRVIK